MRSFRLVLPLLAVSAILALIFGPPPNLPRAQSMLSKPTPCCGGSAVGLRELDFPYYSLRDGFSSQLNLVSDSPHPIDLTLAIYSQHGASVLHALTIQPSAKLPIDLRELLTRLKADVAGDFGEGSMAVYFEGTIMPVVGQITITNPTRRLVPESEMVENDPGRTDIPAVLNTVWWNLAPGRDASIMVANMSARAVTADVFLDYQGQRHPSAPLTFNPHELKTVSVIELLGEQNASAATAPEGGIAMMQRGGVPSLIAQGKILDPVTGFSTTLHFPSPELERASALHADGIPIGKPSKDSSFAGMGYFVPHVVVRNLLPTPQTVSLTVEYPKGSDWDSTESRSCPSGDIAPASQDSIATGSAGSAPCPSGDLTAQLALAPLTLPAYSTRDFSLDSVMGQLPPSVPYGSIRIQFSGPPSSLVAEVSSVERRNDLVVDSRLENEGNGWAGSGANPWHLDNETNSILFLTDMSDQPSRIGFSVTADNVHYYLCHLILNPHETRAIDLRKLRDAQQPDCEKHVIPAGATDGSVYWIRIDNVPVMGRLVVIQRHGAVASSYDCCPCPCPPVLAAVVPSPASATIAVTTTKQFTDVVTFEDCNEVPSQGDGPTIWSSDNSSVATMSGATATGQGGGTADITVTVGGCLQYTYLTRDCTCELDGEVDGTASLTVQVPTSLSIVSGTDSTTKEATCNSGVGTGCGVTRSFTYQVLDQNGHALTGSWIGSQQVWDAIQVTSPNGLGATGFVTACSPPNTGPCGKYVNSLGEFPELGLIVCSTVCYANHTCVTAGYTAANQTIHIGSYSIVQRISYYCDHVLVNGH